MASPTPETILQKGLARRPSHIHSTKLLTNQEILAQIFATRSIPIPLHLHRIYHLILHV
jgi:hypothetical protein